MRRILSALACICTMFTASACNGEKPPTKIQSYGTAVPQQTAQAPTNPTTLSQLPTKHNEAEWTHDLSPVENLLVRYAISKERNVAFDGDVYVAWRMSIFAGGATIDQKLNPSTIWEFWQKIERAFVGNKKSIAALRVQVGPGDGTDTPILIFQGKVEDAPLSGDKLATANEYVPKRIVFPRRTAARTKQGTLIGADLGVQVDFEPRLLENLQDLAAFAVKVAASPLPPIVAGLADATMEQKAKDADAALGAFFSAKSTPTRMGRAFRGQEEGNDEAIDIAKLRAFDVTVLEQRDVRVTHNPNNRVLVRFVFEPETTTTLFGEQRRIANGEYRPFYKQSNISLNSTITEAATGRKFYQLYTEDPVLLARFLSKTDTFDDFKYACNYLRQTENGPLKLNGYDRVALPALFLSNYGWVTSQEAKSSSFKCFTNDELVALRKTDITWPLDDGKSMTPALNFANSFVTQKNYVDWMIEDEAATLSLFQSDYFFDKTVLERQRRVTKSTHAAIDILLSKKITYASHLQREPLNKHATRLCEGTGNNIERDRLVYIAVNIGNTPATLTARFPKGGWKISKLEFLDREANDAPICPEPQG